MSTSTPAYLEVIDFLAERINPEALIAFRPSEAVQRRVADLVARNAENRLSEEEQQELADFFRLEHLMIMAKAEVRRKLQTRA